MAHLRNLLLTFCLILAVLVQRTQASLFNQSALVQQLSDLALPDLFSSSSPLCQSCHTVFRTIQHWPRQPALRALEIISTQYCVRKHLQIQKVCQGAVKEMTQYILTSAWEHFTDPHAACHKIRMCPKQYKLLTLSDFTADLMKDYVERAQEESTGLQKIKMMHVSDIHPDFFYTEGAPAKCDEPVCCRVNVTSTDNNTKKAGRWGSLSDCDIPLSTVNLFLDQVSKMDLDLVLWTGDNTAHDIWQQTQSYNLNYSIVLTDLMKQKLKCPVIASAGNHESAPVNVYDFQGERENFLNAGLAAAWEDWIGHEAAESYRNNGFYSVYFEKFNLKVISLNTQAHNDENWFLLRDPTDPGGQLKWLVAELREAEASGKYVYIIGHIPPRSGMLDWTDRYNVIVNRFAYTIRGQYFGHSHEESTTFFNPINGSKEIINSLFISSSLTTYSNKNPEFRIMTVDKQTMRLLDYDQYILKLETELPEIPKFTKFYSLLSGYGLNDFSFASQLLMREGIRTDPAFQKKYIHYQSSGLKPGGADAGIYCDTMATVRERAKCENRTIKPDLFTKVSGPWKELIH